MHHYMIYLDSAGCFEFIAESWEAIQDEAGAQDTKAAGQNVRAAP